jgi:hypothetical protein
MYPQNRRLMYSCGSWFSVRLFMVWMLGLVCLAEGSLTQTSVLANSARSDTAVPIVEGVQRIPDETFLTSKEMQLGLATLFFGLLGIGLVILLIGKTTLTEPMVRLLGLLYIITFVGFICVASNFESGKIAPVVGLFGTALGYLLGAGRDRQPQQAGQSSEATTNNNPSKPIN